MGWNNPPVPWRELERVLSGRGRGQAAGDAGRGFGHDPDRAADDQDTGRDDDRDADAADQDHDLDPGSADERPRGRGADGDVGSDVDLSIRSFRVGRKADDGEREPASAASGAEREARNPGDGGDSPAWSRKREDYEAPDIELAPDAGLVPYAELHCHSNFSFLDGASSPEELVRQAVRLGLDAIAITDHDGMYGAVRFAEAAWEHSVRTIYGAELNLGLTPKHIRAGEPDPHGSHLLVLARDPTGYRELCAAITHAHIGDDDHRKSQADRPKGAPEYDVERLAERGRDHLLVLTGCRKGAVRRALTTEGAPAAARELRRLVELFGRDNVAVELTDHGLPTDDEHNDALAALAAAAALPTVATTAAHYAAPNRRRLANAIAAVRARADLDSMDGWLPPAGTAHLRSGAEMAARFARHPGAVERAAALGLECAFDLRLVAPGLPPFDPPKPGHTPASWLRTLVLSGAQDLYGSFDETPQAYVQIEKELEVIERKNFPGYFLIVHDIVDFCRQQDIFVQGRGSAVNSAVCYALGITKVDAVKMQLLFARFLAPDRDGYPDIDLDIESDRREEVIQYVYRKYGRTRAAQVANVITYRAKSAVRDVARALGHAQGTQDAWSKQLDRWGPLDRTDVDDIPSQVVDLAVEIEGFPRHLGIHSGGMVLADRPVGEVCPVEWATMKDRTVLQWDKDDCASAGLVKFDLLGLGMLSAIHYMVDLVAQWHGRFVERADLHPVDPHVYTMMQAADTVGVFQIESRAQMATLPRLKPEQFYDLVVEVALIRPGPIQGGSVHPYIRRRQGLEHWRPEHPSLINALGKTYGVPIFQEQLMQISIDAAEFSEGEADELRRAMGARRSAEKMYKLKDRFLGGLKAKGVPDDTAENIFEKLLAFANFGFPESHSISFASLVYQSAWFKLYYPAAFCAALLRAQPMGFYSPQSLVADARRHDVTVHGPDINASLVHATLEPLPGHVPPRGEPRRELPKPGAAPVVSCAVRLGLGSVRTIGDTVAERIVAERAANGPFTGTTDLARRMTLSTAQLEALAAAGALGPDRRHELWAAGAAAQERDDRLPGLAVGVEAPELPPMDALETVIADVWATGISPTTYPTVFLRPHLDEIGALTTAALKEVDDGKRACVGGAVTHRQRPATAGGVTFLNLEDETGMLNVVCSPSLWRRYRRVARSSQALVVHGRVENSQGVVSLVAEHLEHLDLRVVSKSRDFR